ncbi:MAG: hypothetical protein AMJ73_00340 [candidate division Zixibacteria bacterium SM1_73]|nr:MAG: hypothetical protein AMJ73_00340 [candidate division Zixibacteria bacterium SM1_73]
MMGVKKHSQERKWGGKAGIILALFLFNQVYADTEPMDIGEWFDRYLDNPLNIPQYGALGAVHPDMLFFPDGEDEYKYWMFYTPYPPETHENPSLVRSNDGMNFVDNGVRNPLIVRTEPWENRHLADPDVIKVGDKWYMYYMGRERGGTACISLAISDDGKNWIKYDSNPVIKPTQNWENNWVGAPALYHDGLKFWMWFCGGYAKGIELASSVDGEDWIRENNGDPVLTGTVWEWDAGGVSHPDVICHKDTLWMYYWGVSAANRYRLGLAKSVDKFNWIKCRYNPILDIVLDSWEGHYIYRSSPIIISDTMWLYYSAYDDMGTTRPRIGLAKSWDKRDIHVKEEGESGADPSAFTLSQNYPNPFNQATNIDFTLAKSGFVSLIIYDILGRKVRILVFEHVSSGYKSVLWDGKNDSGEDVASGVYCYQIGVENFRETKKLVLLK